MSASETKVCQNCKASFNIDAQDFGFYKKIGVPPPTFCPECRNMRRMAWREYISLYRRKCDLCGKPIITIHAPGGPFTVYCRGCYISDKWDPMDYGRDYDFKKPFFEQYRRLMEAVPRPALTGATNIINSDFSHASVNLKNCFNVFWSYFSEDAQNCYALLLSRNAFDCYVADNSDSVYEVLHSNRMYRVRYGYFSDECLDSSFLYNCVGCSDCFGCVNLRKKKYCLFNEQLSKEEYRTRLTAWDLGSYKKLQEAKKKFRELYLATPHRPAHVLNSQNVTGDIIRDAKNCKTCFSALDGVENCKYLFFGGLSLKDSYDVSVGGDTSELMYETMAITGNNQRIFFSAGGGRSHDVWYCDWVIDSSDMFGCISIRNKKHCILNKQYTKEKYEQLIERIRQQMDEVPYRDKKGRIYKYGEFFPIELSAYAYNETFAFPWYPKTKAEALAEGWQWREPARRSYEVTLVPEELPDHIRDVSDSVTKEIIGCAHRSACADQCATAFRITAEELAFYRDMNITLPRLCPNCRLAERFSWRNGFRLWHRACMCESVGHGHNGRCTNEFETTFAPEKPEIIYCDACYRAEFL